MYLSGKKLDALAKGKVVIPRHDGRHIEFTVRALTLGEEDKAYDLYPDIRPPNGFLTDVKGAPLRNERGEVIHGPLLSDPGYLKNQAIAETMRDIVRVALVLDADESLRWETTEPKGSKAYYEAIQQEIKGAGLSFGDLHLILRRAAELANVDNKVLERAAKAFSEREQKDEPQ